MTKQCPDCTQMFDAHHAHCKRCPSCSVRFRNDRQRKRDQERARREKMAAAPVEPPRGRFCWRSDFLLALPELRAELKRQTGNMTMPQLLPTDPLDIPILGTQRGTGRQGHR